MRSTYEWPTFYHDLPSLSRHEDFYLPFIFRDRNVTRFWKVRTTNVCRRLQNISACQRYNVFRLERGGIWITATPTPRALRRMVIAKHRVRTDVSPDGERTIDRGMRRMGTARHFVLSGTAVPFHPQRKRHPQRSRDPEKRHHTEE